jgi:hypothetical protein
LRERDSREDERNEDAEESLNHGCDYSH